MTFIHKSIVTLILGLALIGYAVAGDNPDFFERVRAVLPTGWEIGQKVGISDYTITRTAMVLPRDLADNPDPPPSLSPGDDVHTKGIRVWFVIEPIGVCSDAEYLRRKFENAKIWAQLEPLRKKIERIHRSPRVKPSLLACTPRNKEEQSWLTEYTVLWKQLQLLPTHHYDNKAFFVFLLRSYDGVIIKTPAVRDEIDGVRKIVETVLVPYESQGNPQQDAGANRDPL